MVIRRRRTMTTRHDIFTMDCWMHRLLAAGPHPLIPAYKAWPPRQNQYNQFGFALAVRSPAILRHVQILSNCYNPFISGMEICIDHISKTFIGHHMSSHSNQSSLFGPFALPTLAEAMRISRPGVEIQLWQFSSIFDSGVFLSLSPSFSLSLIFNYCN